MVYIFILKKLYQQRVPYPTMGYLFDNAISELVKNQEDSNQKFRETFGKWTFRQQRRSTKSGCRISHLTFTLSQNWFHLLHSELILEVLHIFLRFQIAPEIIYGSKPTKKVPHLKVWSLNFIIKYLIKL